MATTTDRESPLALKGVSYRMYVKLRNAPGNQGYRMTYYDGILEIMSPEFIHENPARRLEVLVRAVVAAFGIPCIGAGSTTFRRGGQDLQRGHGKEPDTSFYFANAALIAGRKKINLDVDPPPELWIEVDNRGSSKGRLPLYAALGVPEVWRYRARSGRLWFGRLVGGSYEAIDRSLALPMLTPELVRFALGRCGPDETAWDNWLRAWARDELLPGYRPS